MLQLVCALLPLLAAGAGGDWLWTVQRGGSSSDFGRALQVDQDNNLVVAGETRSSLDNYTLAGSDDAFLMKFTSNGAWLWTVQRGGSGRDRVRALQVDQDNNLVVAGTTDSSLDNSTNSGGTDAFLMKFTSNGTWLWTVQRGGSDWENVYTLQVDQDNNLVVAGDTESSLDNYTNSGGTDAFLMKFASNGTWLWTVQRGGSDWDNVYAFQVDQDNNLVIAGATEGSLDGYTNAGDSDIFLMKFTSNGTWLWTVQRGGSGYEATKALQVDQDNNLVVAGYTRSSLENYTNAGSADAFFMTFTSNGAWLCTVQRGGSDFDDVSSLEVDRDNNMVAAGTTMSSLDNYTNAGGNDVFLMSLESCSIAQTTTATSMTSTSTSSTTTVSSSTASSATSTSTVSSATTSSATSASTTSTPSPLAVVLGILGALLVGCCCLGVCFVLCRKKRRAAREPKEVVVVAEPAEPTAPENHTKVLVEDEPAEPEKDEGLRQAAVDPAAQLCKDMEAESMERVEI
ncbi:unnamed protein product [Symbiodinium natans]|uniref:Bulb-type lectin domain-containing protein n=1 Tax=Symbiodinium natans TaxID=878477 RepID=A0A812Q0R5_9DINO|nr:unnamed protein product [Symbiodinium natans]